MLLNVFPFIKQGVVLYVYIYVCILIYICVYTLCECLSISTIHACIPRAMCAIIVSSYLKK